MEFNWDQITQFRKVQVVAIEFTDQDVCFHIAQLKRSKGKVVIQSAVGDLRSNSIAEYIKASRPILIHVIGKGVLNRNTSQDEDYLETVLMAANPDDFYVNYIDIDDNRYVSFSRKKSINEALAPLENFEENILDMVVGPYYMFVEDIRQKIGSTPIGKIVRTNGVYSFKPSDSLKRAQFDNQLFNKEFYPITVGAAFLLNNLAISVFDAEQRKRKRSSFRDKQQFKYIGIAALAFFLVALIGNYFYQGYINDENAKLEAKIMVFSDNLKKIDQIDQEVLRKKQLIANSGIIRSNYFSTTLDQIGASVPSSISLEEIQVYPLEKKLKRNEKPSFKRKIIKVAGATQSSENVDLWIDKLNELDWVDNVAILSFTTNDDKKKAFFELKIIEH